ncbi:hypothetical protein HYU17_00040 [Candidatus Woesearchaeota archaeon]|nr:hypothetical protein [Candidatus Woesearchaeota archaeon]
MAKSADEFEELKKELEAADSKREDVIAKSREIVKQSKKAIYALQRNDTLAAAAVLAEMKKGIASLKPFLSDANYAGTIKPAIQEYVEAACFNEFVLTGEMLPRKELGVSAEHYIAGLCDLSGEIIRKAINAAINDNPGTVVAAKRFIERLYYGLLQLDLRNGELRKKFDGLKYDLKKMEDVLLSLKLQGKVK